MTRLEATTRAQLAAWRGELRRTRDAAALRCRRRSRELLVVCGALGMLGGAAIVGWWLMGLTLMAESLFAAWVGLNQDDGAGLPRRGARTAAEVLEDERLRP